jgi:hypothetical protein
MPFVSHLYQKNVPFYQPKLCYSDAFPEFGSIIFNLPTENFYIRCMEFQSIQTKKQTWKFNKKYGQKAIHQSFSFNPNIPPHFNCNYSWLSQTLMSFDYTLRVRSNFCSHDPNIFYGRSHNLWIRPHFFRWSICPMHVFWSHTSVKIPCMLHYTLSSTFCKYWRTMNKLGDAWMFH